MIWQTLEKSKHRCLLKTKQMFETKLFTHFVNTRGECTEDGICFQNLITLRHVFDVLPQRIRRKGLHIEQDRSQGQPYILSTPRKVIYALKLQTSISDSFPHERKKSRIVLEKHELFFKITHTVFKQQKMRKICIFYKIFTKFLQNVFT